MKHADTIIVAMLLSLFIGIDSDAQTFALGVRGGISIPNLTSGSSSNPVNTGYGSRLGPDLGITGEYRISALFSLEAIIQYSSQGGKKEGLQGLITPPAFAAMFPPGQAPLYLYANYKSEAKLNYLLIPILAKFGWNLGKSPWRFYIDAGPFVGFLLSAKQVTSGQSALYLDAAGQQPLPAGIQSFDNTEDIKNQLHTTNVGIEGNLGFSYRVGHGALFIEGGANYGFLNIQKNAIDGTNNTGAANVDIGYYYWFGYKKRQSKSRNKLREVKTKHPARRSLYRRGCSKAPQIPDL